MESAFKNFSFGRRINDVRDVRIDFGPPRKSRGLIFSHVPDGTVFMVQLEGEIIVHTSFAPGALNREQVEQRCTDVTG
jgi:hypothetical protein